MEDIISVTVYKQFGDLTGDRRNKKGDIFDPQNIADAPPEVIAQRKETLKQSFEAPMVSEQPHEYPCSGGWISETHYFEH
jgi:hypothetical protein